MRPALAPAGAVPGRLAGGAAGRGGRGRGVVPGRYFGYRRSGGRGGKPGRGGGIDRAGHERYLGWHPNLHLAVFDLGGAV